MDQPKLVQMSILQWYSFTRQTGDKASSRLDPQAQDFCTIDPSIQIVRARHFPSFE